MNTATSIFPGLPGWSELRDIVLGYSRSGIYILVDENTRNFCLPVLLDKCPGLKDAVVIEFVGGEENKTLAGAEKIWRNLIAGEAVRSSLLICLGGGVVTDIGGFAAASFKRGMDFIHIPTTLLAMVDASIGGKTGVNLDSIKNQIGVFALPKAVFIFTEFLKTLPERQRLSGYAEMLKHAMLDSESHFEKLLLLNSPEKVCNENNVLESVNVKTGIIESDFNESGMRKVLNFGHTIGHAVETYSQKHDADPLMHGEAIAIGLICESFISLRLLDFSQDDLKKMASLVSWHFPHYRLKPKAADELIAIMMHDKKNPESSKINFSLLRKTGQPVYDQYPGERLIRESLHFYVNLEVGFFV